MPRTPSGVVSTRSASATSRPARRTPTPCRTSAATIAWAADDRTLFYVENDPTTLRSHRVRRHVLGTDARDDVLVYEERDEAYYTSVYRTTSDAYVVVALASTESDEQRVLPADEPDGALRLFAPRRAKFHYQAVHIATGRGGSRWIVRTDWQAPNYRLMEVAADAIGDRAAWKPLVPHDDAVFINDVDLFRDHYVIDERSDGLRRLRVVPWSGGASFHIDSDEPAYTTSLGENDEQATHLLRYDYTSLTTPHSVFELDMRTGEKRLLKQTPVLGGFDAAHYATERVWVAAKDGARIPVSLVYRAGFAKDGTAPLLQYGYGAYGASMDPAFRSSVLSLLDRGFVYAIAHVRGGEEMGRAWYEDGKKLKKKNTFTDFIAVTEALVAQGYGAQRPHLHRRRQRRRPAVGAVVNLRPDLYRGVVAQVPFVDVVTTMLDESIPLTTNEYDEWGDPKLQDLLPLHAVVLAVRQRARQAVSRRCSCRPACTTRRSSTSSRRSGSRSCASGRPATARWSSRSTWRPATAASRAASGGCTRSPRSTRSCSTCSASRTDAEACDARWVPDDDRDDACRLATCVPATTGSSREGPTTTAARAPSRRSARPAPRRSGARPRRRGAGGSSSGCCGSRSAATAAGSRRC